MKKIILLFLVSFISANVFGQTDDVLLKKAQTNRQEKAAMSAKREASAKRERAAAQQRAEEAKIKREYEQQQSKDKLDALRLERWKFVRDSTQECEKIALENMRITQECEKIALENMRIRNKRKSDSISSVNNRIAAINRRISDSTTKAVNHLAIKKSILERDWGNAKWVIDNTLAEFPDCPQVLADQRICETLHGTYMDSVRVITYHNFHHDYRRFYGHSGAAVMSLVLPGSGDVLVDGKFKVGHAFVMASYIATALGAVYFKLEANKNYTLYLNSTNFNDIHTYYNNTANFDNLALGCAITAGSILLTDFIRVKVKNGINKRNLRMKMAEHDIEMPENYKSKRYGY